MKLPITKEWLASKAAAEGDTDPTTGSPEYVPGFVPSAADKHYGAIIGQYVAALAAKDAEIEKLKAALHGKEPNIRKAGQTAIDILIDGWSDTIVLPGSDDLADYLTRIVDACVSAALKGDAQ